MLIAGCGEKENTSSFQNNSEITVWIEKCNLSKRIVIVTKAEDVFIECKKTGENWVEEKNSFLTKTGNTALDAWVGEYEFEEAAGGPPLMVMDYEMEIYKEEGRCFAEIEKMGQTTMASIRAEVDGNEDEIRLLFREYLPDHIIGFHCEKGDVVLRFTRENGELYTYWGEMGPLLYENEESGRVYFTQKVDNNPEELSTWLGEYAFSEVSDNPETEFNRLDYRIKIYREDDRFFAEVQADGEETYIRVKAEVRGDKDKICLFLEEILPGHVCSSINKEGSILLKLRENATRIYTDWGEIVPMLEENQEYGKEYFKKAE